jgi:DNA-binding NtrC family response regulator
VLNSSTYAKLNVLLEQNTFIKADCTHRDPNFFHSEIFGHVKGAFTGATQSKDGKAKMARRGALFLDEIGELSQESQSKLLQFLESGEFEALGDNRLSRFDGTLVVAATHKPVGESLGYKEEQFRPELYYRFAQRLIIRPLRERKGDIIPIALTALQKVAEEAGQRVQVLTTEARDWLQSYDWSVGNARQLASLVQQAAVNARGNEVRLNHLKEAWNDDPANDQFPECRTAGTHGFDTPDEMRQAVDPCHHEAIDVFVRRSRQAGRD